MKHTIKKGSVGRALIPYRFTRHEKVIIDIIYLCYTIDILRSLIMK